MAQPFKAPLTVVRAVALPVFLGLLTSAVVVDARTPTVPRPADPFADPKHDPYNPLRYIASNTLTAVAFSLVLATAIAQTICMAKWGARWMLSMTIGAYTFALGLAFRFGLHSHPESKGIYIAEYLFVVLSPCAFIAADYVLLGRLALHLNSEKYLLVPPRRITLIFVLSDVTTFLIQAAGGATLVGTNDIKVIDRGEHIFLAGLALQLLSFLIFTCVYLVFLFRIYTKSPHSLKMDADKPWYSRWQTLAGALILSCIGILIRSVYRTIEIGQGFGGGLSISEPFFYGLDTLPLFLAIAIYVPFWPGRFIPVNGTAAPTPGDNEVKDSETATATASPSESESAVHA